MKWNDSSAVGIDNRTRMMDHLQTSSSSQLSSVSSTSSLPSLSGSIAESDAQPEPLRPQESTATSVSGRAGCDGISQPQRPITPFKSFRSLRSTGPFHPLGSGQIHVIILSLASAAVAVATAASTTQHRQLEDEEGGWTGEWNGEWQANSDAEYEKGWDDDGAAASSESGGMWLNDPDPDAWTQEQIITYVSIGILSFMTLLCCVCYPEILVVGCAKVCSCCGVGRGAAKDAAAGVDEDMEADYVGGAQDEKRKKKRRNSKTKRERSSSRNSSRSRDVELV